MVFRSSESGTKGKYITAIDYKTGKIAWRHLQVSAGEGESNTGLTTPRENCSLAAMPTATWSLTTRRMETRYGIPTSARYRMQWRPTCLTAASTFGGLWRFSLCVRFELLSLDLFTARTTTKPRYPCVPGFRRCGHPVTHRVVPLLAAIRLLCCQGSGWNPASLRLSLPWRPNLGRLTDDDHSPIVPGAANAAQAVDIEFL